MSNVISLSEAASIGLHAMALIARSDKLTSVDSIAKATSTSRHHVAKILQRLVKDGFLTSQRGPKGGFLMKKKPEDVSFLDIYESIEGKIEISECPMHKEVCPFNECIMSNVTKQMTLNFVDYLKSQVLSQYVINLDKQVGKI